MVLARLYWPASSITKRSRLWRATRLSLAKSQAVPPITHPSWSATNDGYSFSASSRHGAELPFFFFPTRSAGTPASTTPSSRFSTTACDCATTPMRQWCSLTSRLITAADV